MTILFVSAAKNLGCFHGLIMKCLKTGLPTRFLFDSSRRLDEHDVIAEQHSFVFVFFLINSLTTSSKFLSSFSHSECVIDTAFQIGDKDCCSRDSQCFTKSFQTIFHSNCHIIDHSVK